MNVTYTWLGGPAGVPVATGGGGSGDLIFQVSLIVGTKMRDRGAKLVYNRVGDVGVMEFF